MLVYLLKANIALTLFYLTYRFGLRRLTFYTLNRFFLMAGIVCSATFPFINPFQQHVPVSGTMINYVPDLAALNNRPATPLINVILLYIFWTGVIVMGLRLLIQFMSLLQLHKSTVQASIDEHPVRITKKKVSPFSFMTNIYINPSLHSPTELLAVVKHENVHVKQWHSLDIILGELNRVFYWFNPGAWLMSIAIRENLEFITDRYVLAQGMDVKTYQYSLVQVSGIPYATAIANNFNFSHLKQRIMMMNKQKSSRYQLLRYLVLGCLVGIALFSLNITRAGNKISLHFTPITDTVTPPPPPPAAPLPPPPPVPPTKAVAPPAPATTIQKVITFSGEKEEGKAKTITFTTSERGKAAETITVTSGKNEVRLGDDKAVFFIDDEYVGHTLPAIDGKDIDNIQVFNGESAVEKAGEKAKDGVVYIYTKRFAATPAPAVVLRGIDVKNPMYVVDGKVVSAEEAKKIESSTIATVNVLKGESATAIYGSGAENGVVLITLKK
jgi:TonB-dependent SusC/RagA subfamily outer membrane receptor